MSDSYPLIESVNHLEENNHHSMVLYDNPNYGTAIKKQFIENGLKKGEHTICFTPDDVDLLEKEIAAVGQYNPTCPILLCGSEAAKLLHQRQKVYSSRRKHRGRGYLR